MATRALNSTDEFVDLANANGIIDVRGDDFGSVLLVEGNAIALNWCDCAGSVAQYMARAGAMDYEENLRALRYTLEGHLLDNVPLSSQLHSFLGLLVSGRYRLQYHSGVSDVEMIEYKANLDPTAHDHFYPFGSVLICTQPTDTLNQDRVAHYVKAIHSGQRPIAISAAVEKGWCDFVLDGHHKLQAYKATKIAPPLISICRVGAPRLSEDCLGQYFGEYHPMNSHYRRVKGRYDA